jgi:hypothetical protein
MLPFPDGQNLNNGNADPAQNNPIEIASPRANIEAALPENDIRRLFSQAWRRKIYIENMIIEQRGNGCYTKWCTIL